MPHDEPVAAARKTAVRDQRDLVAEPVLSRDLEHLGTDEALDEAEDVGVGTALHLRQQAPLVCSQERELVDLRQAGGQERLREIEVAAADHVRLDVPARALRRLDG